MKNFKSLLASVVLVFYALLAGASVDNDGNMEPWFIALLVIGGIVLIIAVIAAIISGKKAAEQRELALKSIPSSAKSECDITEGSFLYDSATRTVFAVSYDDKKHIVKKYENFVKSQSYAYNGHYVLVDEENQQILYVHTTTFDGIQVGADISSKIIPFEQILGVEICENGNSVFQKSTSSAVGRAIVGGVLLGGVGAVIGGVTGKDKEKKTLESYKIMIQLADVKNPSFTIDLVKTAFEIDDAGKVKYNAISSFSEKVKSTLLTIIKANEIKLNLVQAQTAAVLNAQAQQQMLESQEPKAIDKGSAASSVADELLKLSELHKSGILSDEEFEEQKKKLLNQ